MEQDIIKRATLHLQVGAYYNWFFLEDYHEEVFGDLRLRPHPLIRVALFGGRYPRIDDSRKEIIKKYIRHIPLDDIGNKFKKSKHTREFLNSIPRWKGVLNFVEKNGIPSPIEITSPAGWVPKYRIHDGSHRRAIAEFLGMKNIPCLLYSKKEVRIYTGGL